MAQIQKEKTQQLILNIAPSTREKIYEVMRRMTWADEVISKEEAIVMEVIAEALQLDMNLVEAEVNFQSNWLDDTLHFSQKDKELIFICAAWLSAVDDDIANEELTLMEDLRETFEIENERMEELKTKMLKIRNEKAEIVPQWESSPWWEEFERLLLQALEITA